MPEIVDDKSDHCIPFILERLQSHRESHQSRGQDVPPFFLGLNGVQGAGKTTLVETLCNTLSCPPHNLPVIVLSIDDLYLPHARQEALAKSHPDNPLVQHRGQPSTHDVQLGKALFDDLVGRRTNIRVPSYDKSAFNGAGDQRPESDWHTVNAAGSPPVEVIVFEGWCVGFRPLSDSDVERKWRAAKEAYERDGEAYRGQLGKQRLESALFVNTSLRDYDVLTDRFGAFVHIDAEDTLYVYDWRQQQEAVMRAEKGRGMSVEQVDNFINGYYPAYELYTDVLRHGIFEGEKGKQLRLVVNKDRRVTEVHRI